MKQIIFPSQITYYIIYNDDNSVVYHGSVNTTQQMTTPLDNMETFLVESDCQNRLLSGFNIFYSSADVYYILYKTGATSAPDILYGKLQSNEDLKKTLDNLETYADEQSWSTQLKNVFNITVGPGPIYN
jgi:hypothetical protein